MKLPRHLPAQVFVLGLVSLLMDLSSESIHALLPLYMVNVLGLSVLAIGALDGASEALTLAVKPLAGWLSDRAQKRKPLTLLGYGLSALSKPLFALSGGLALIIFARLLDRCGKGIRGAPRDALIADVTPSELRGEAYGLRQSLDTVGALLAPLAASFLIVFFSGNYRAVFWCAGVPALLAVWLLARYVQEPEQHQHIEPAPQQHDKALTLAEPINWPVLLPVFALAAGISLVRPAEAFLILRAQSLGFSNAQAPLFLVVLNIVYALSAFPLGRLFDRIGASGLLLSSLLVLIIAHLLLAHAMYGIELAIGAGLWGLHMGLSQSVIASLVSQRARRAHRALTFGLYALFVGLALLVSGTLMGALWQFLSPALAFAGMALLSSVLLLFCLSSPGRRMLAA